MTALTSSSERKRLTDRCAWAEMPETSESAGRRSLTPDEAKRVLKAAEGHRLEALFVTGMMLGLRPGELTGLSWDDVDLEDGALIVSGSLKSERSTLRLGETKTKRARAVDLPAPVPAALKAHSKRQKEARLKIGSPWRKTGLAFTTEVGTPIDPSNLRRLTKTLCEDAKVEPVSPNELGRHTAASLLYDAGMPLDEIAELLGHKSTRMLEVHYKHPVSASFGGHVEYAETIFGAG